MEPKRRIADLVASASQVSCSKNFHFHPFLESKTLEGNLKVTTLLTQCPHHCLWDSMLHFLQASEPPSLGP